MVLSLLSGLNLPGKTWKISGLMAMLFHYGVPTLSKEERRDRALARYKRIIQEGFREAETGIITDISAEK